MTSTNYGSCRCVCGCAHAAVVQISYHVIPGGFRGLLARLRWRERNAICSGCVSHVIDDIKRRYAAKAAS